MPTPFAQPPTRYGPAWAVACFVDGVGGHDRVRELRAAVGGERADAPGHAASSSSMCSGSPITPVEHGEHVLGCEAERGRGRRRRGARRRRRRVARGRVGLAGVHEHRARRAAGDPRRGPASTGAAANAFVVNSAGDRGAGVGRPAARGRAARSA